MVARVVQEWGRVDVLVANAGGGRGRPMDTKASTLDPALLHLVVEMNLYGTVYSCNAVAPIMKEQRSGKIITISSVAGTAPSADGGYAHYGAAKAAIAHYTRYLAQDLGPFGITVNCIAPGVIATGRIMATIIRAAARATAIGPSHSKASRNGRGLRQGRRVPRDRPLRLCDRGGDPNRWRLGAGIIGSVEREHLVADQSAARDRERWFYTENIHSSYTARPDTGTVSL
jgi:NAD(P)-dependent dehydrogenase (short-subunit alcohol dehydrogenase family)